MYIEKMCHWANNSVKLSEKPSISSYKDANNITDNSLKLEKVFSQQPILFKSNTSLYSNTSNILGPSTRLLKNLPLP